MAHKMTISSVAFLSDCVMEEGSTVYVEDSGKTFRCIRAYGDGLSWELEAKNRFDFPEAQLQLQEITFEAPARDSLVAKSQVRSKTASTAKKEYLH